MTSTTIAMLIKPFVLLVFFGLIVLPLKLLFQRVIPDGKLKRILFKKIS